MHTIVLDTCVLVDMFMVSRPRHKVASRLHQEMNSSRSVAKVPAFAIFEVVHAIKQAFRVNNGKMLPKNHQNFGEENGLNIELVPVDEKFTQKFLDLDLPEIRAGDLVFAALAKGESLPLVTEDQPFYRKAKEAGILVFTISEYLEHTFNVKV